MAVEYTVTPSHVVERSQQLRLADVSGQEPKGGEAESEGPIETERGSFEPIGDDGDKAAASPGLWKRVGIHLVGST